MYLQTMVRNQYFVGWISTNRDKQRHLICFNVTTLVDLSKLVSITILYCAQKQAGLA